MKAEKRETIVKTTSVVVTMDLETAALLAHHAGCAAADLVTKHPGRCDHPTSVSGALIDLSSAIRAAL